MATSPIYFTTPGNAQVNLDAPTAQSTINTASPTAVVSALVGTAAGRRVSRVRAASRLDTTPAANKLTFWLSTDGGANKRFVCDVLLASASTSSATVRTPYVEVPELVGLVLQSTNTILYVGSYTTQASTLNIEYNDA